MQTYQYATIHTRKLTIHKYTQHTNFSFSVCFLPITNYATLASKHRKNWDTKTNNLKACRNPCNTKHNYDYCNLYMNSIKLFEDNVSLFISCIDRGHKLKTEGICTCQQLDTGAQRNSCFNILPSPNKC